MSTTTPTSTASPDTNAPTMANILASTQPADYLGLADQLKKALVTYTKSVGQGDPNFDTAQAIAVMPVWHSISTLLSCRLPHMIDDRQGRSQCL